MAGYGNKTAPIGEAIPHEGPKYGSGLGNSDPYSGATEHGSGTTGGPGFGNKTTADPDNLDFESTRLDKAHLTHSYSGGTEYGSGTTAGAGAGNKTGNFGEKNDSTAGKLMEKVGGMLKNDGLVEKGKEKREAAGYGQSQE